MLNKSNTKPIIGEGKLDFKIDSPYEVKSLKLISSQYDPSEGCKLEFHFQIEITYGMGRNIKYPVVFVYVENNQVKFVGDVPHRF